MTVDEPSDALLNLIDKFEKLGLVPKPPEPSVIDLAGPRYDAMDPKKTGLWKAIVVGGLPVATAWTDRDRGFGILALVQGPVIDELRNYVRIARGAGVPAVFAFDMLDGANKFMDPDIGKVSLGPVSLGPLSQSLDYRGGPATTAPQPKVEEE
jgi:hypothetical protein